jgi:hypothetical protein
MNETQFAATIAEKVASDTKFWIAMVGLIGAVIGSLLTLCGNVLLHWLRTRPQKELDKRRLTILKEMLDDNRFPEKWRNLSTMSAVIGADESETKRLLIKAKARGSETADSKWGLIKNHPFPSSQ